MSNEINESFPSYRYIAKPTTTSQVSPELVAHFKSEMEKVENNDPKSSHQKHGWGACLKKSDLELGAKNADKKWPKGAPKTKLSEAAITKIVFHSSVNGKADIQANLFLDDDEYKDYAKKQGRRDYKKAGGNVSSFEEGIRIYAQSPMGKKVLTNLVNSKQVLNVYALNKGAAGSGHKIEHSANGPFAAYAIAHEFGHTVFSPGGARWDHHNPDYPKSKRINNVAIHDNAFREFIKMPSRECYKENIPSNWGYGETFNKHGTKIK